MQFDQLKRRQFITLLGGAAVWPLAARAQHSAKPVVGFLHAASLEANRNPVEAFVRSLSQTGYAEGKNVAIEYHWANGQYDRLPALAAELVRRQVSVIAAGTPVAALAAQKATTSIPVVFGLGSDPVKDGLVANLARPGGNITGATFFSNLLDAKRLSLLHQLAPDAKVIAVLLNPKNANAELEKQDTQEAARTLGLELVVVQASTEREIDDSVGSLSQQHARALLVAGDAFLNGRADQIAKLAVRYALPTCFTLHQSAAAGGLMSYGADITDTWRQVGKYVGRILKGEKPGDLPVQQPTKFEFIVNLTTAKALGLTIPASLLSLADELID
jgi:putative tryptophan/tyrosine transport system substrate-binding protein